MPSLVLFRIPRPVSGRFIGGPDGAGVRVPFPFLYALPFPERSEILLGRETATCDIVLDDARHRVSRRHAVLFADGDRCTVRDISTNGTRLNGVPLPVTEPTPIAHGDVLDLCGFHFRYADDRRGCGPEPGILQRFEPEWRTEHTVGLAGRMWDERDFAALPILADALEEAGCDNQDILAHCRDWPAHDPECWVVARVLGLEPPHENRFDDHFEMD